MYTVELLQHLMSCYLQKIGTITSLSYLMLLDSKPQVTNKEKYKPWLQPLIPFSFQFQAKMSPKAFHFLPQSSPHGSVLRWSRVSRNLRGRVSVVKRTEVTATSFLSPIKGLTGYGGRGAEFSEGSAGQLLVKNRRGPGADTTKGYAHRGQTDSLLQRQLKADQRKKPPGPHIV